MGNAVVRLGDSCTGHGCFPARTNTSASSDVFTNTRGVHRVGDGWAVHGCGDCVPHASSQSSGSASVFVNGRAIARIGDTIACGGSNANGSPDVFAG